MTKYPYLICVIVGCVLGWYVTSAQYKADIAKTKEENERIIRSLVEKHNEELAKETFLRSQAISERDKEIERNRKLELDLASSIERLRSAKRSGGVPKGSSDTRVTDKRSNGKCSELLVRLSDSGSRCCALLGKLNADRNAVRKMK